MKTLYEVQAETLRDYTKKLLEGKKLSYEEAFNSFMRMGQGLEEPEIISSFLTAFRMRREEPEELAGFSDAMTEMSMRIIPRDTENTIDIVGTGGAKFKSFNVSTTSSFLLATLGTDVAKHGNRSNSSPSGSADMLEALGINLSMGVERAQKCLDKTGYTYLFAPTHHPAMKHVVPVRKKLGFRTIFNIMGPLSNPAGVRKQLTGLFSLSYHSTIIESFKRRGFQHVILATSNIGADEVTNCGTTSITELRDNEIYTYNIRPRNFGIDECRPKEIANVPPAQAARTAARILAGQMTKGPLVDFVLVNTAMALKLKYPEETFSQLLETAREGQQSGKAIDLVQRVVKQSGGQTEKVEELIG